MKTNTFICIAVAIASAFAGYTLSKKAEETNVPNTNISWKEYALMRTEEANAQYELLHTIYAADTTAWKETVMQTKEYHTLDSLIEGDWEDFYLY